MTTIFVMGMSPYILYGAIFGAVMGLIVYFMNKKKQP
jgi:hypothetical protein